MWVSSLCDSTAKGKPDIELVDMTSRFRTIDDIMEVTTKGYSVLDIVKAFERVNDVKIPYVIDDRRPGEIAICYSDPSKARTELGWKAEYRIEEMCRDSWNWQRKNPDGY